MLQTVLWILHLVSKGLSYLLGLQEPVKRCSDRSLMLSFRDLLLFIRINWEIPVHCFHCSSSNPYLFTVLHAGKPDVGGLLPCHVANVTLLLPLNIWLSLSIRYFHQL